MKRWILPFLILFWSITAYGAELSLRVQGMMCSSCEEHVAKILQGTKGVTAAKIEREKERAIVTYDPAKVTPDALVKALRKGGYLAEPLPAAKR